MAEAAQEQARRTMFRIRDRESCDAAIRNGGWAAMVSASVTGLLAVIGLLARPTTEEQAAQFDPWSLLDAALIVVLGVFIFRRSRVASTLMFVYFLVSKLYFTPEPPSLSAIPISIIFLVFYFNALRGTFLWHSRYENAPESSVA